MASTYSTNLAIELIGTGDQAGAWGNTTNTNLGTLIEQAISGYVTQAVSTGTDTTITIPNGATGVARNMYIELTGTGGASTNLIVPANKKLYFIFNNTSSGQVTVKVSGQTGVSVPNKAKMILVSNGTDIVDATNYVGNLSAASANITVLTSASATISNLLATSLTVSGNTFLATSSGNVGIGTSSPQAPLHVKGSGATEILRLETTDGTGDCYIRYTDSGGAKGYVGFVESATDNFAIHNVENSPMLFYTNNTEKMRISADGNLGLGVTPNSSLAAYNFFQIGSTGNTIFGGGATATAGITQNGYYSSGWKYAGTGAASQYEQGAGSHKWYNAASGTAGNAITFTQAMTLDASSNLSVGTTSNLLSAASRVTVSVNGASSSAIAFGVGDTRRGHIYVDGSETVFAAGQGGQSQVMTFQTNGSERARITSGGDFGIGTTSPLQKLDVRGAQVIGSSTTVFSTISRSLAPSGSQGILISACVNLSETSNGAISYADTSSFGATISLTGNAADQYGGSIVLEAYGSGADGNLIVFKNRSGSGTTAERARITSDGNFLVGKTVTDLGTAGVRLAPEGFGWFTRNNECPLVINRLTSDGDLVQFYQAGTQEGSISVSGNTVSYNAFAGSHWSQLQDGSKPDILRGTVMESINELCVWPDETNERLPKSKISDTAGSKKVYGVFMAWDNDWTATNDMYVTAVGAFICRVNGSVTVQEGDLLESNGDGTARVQADDIIRSSTIGKVTSTVKTHEYDDGSYCVPTVLYCG